MDVGLCEHAYCVHPMAPGWTLTKQVSQHDHWSSVTWQMKPWKGTCNCSKGKAQEIKCHPKPSGVQNPLDAVRLGDRLKRWRQLRFKKKTNKKKRWRPCDQFVLWNNILGCVIFGSGSAAPGGCWSFVLPKTDRHRGQPPGLVGRGVGGGSIQRSALLNGRNSVWQEKSCWLEETLWL